MKEIISHQVREKYFKEIFKELSKESNRKPVFLSREWAKTFPKAPGVYCFYIDGKLKYVGETGNISERMADMLNTKNHNLRRLVGEVKFSKHVGYVKANSKNSYVPEIELKLTNWMRKHLTVSTLSIHIGRKEFEDWIQEINPSILFLNKPKKRK